MPTIEELTKRTNELLGKNAFNTTTGQPITSADIQPTPQIPFQTPAYVPVPDVTKLNAEVPAPIVNTALENKAQSLNDRLQELQSSLVGQSAFRVEQEKAQGIETLTKTQTDLASQLKAIQNEAQAIPLQLQQEAIGRGITTGGLQPLQTARLRANAIQALGVSSLLEASRGNLATAQSLVDRAVAAKYDPIKEEIAAKMANLDLIIKSPDYTNAEKSRAEAQKAIQDKKEKEIKKQEENEKATQAEVLKYAGIADSVTLNEMKNAKTPLEVAQIAASKGLQTLETQKSSADLALVKANTAKAYADAQKTISESGGVPGIEPENLIAYAQQYASTGKIPTGIPKGSFGVVAQYAKESPKQEGAVIDVNTGVKPDISDAKIDGFASLYDLTKKLDEAKALYDNLHTGFVSGVWKTILPTEGQQKYDAIISEITDLLARSRTGAAITAYEEEQYLSKLPGKFNKSFFIGKDGDTKIETLKSSLSNKLDTSLRAGGSAIVGFSKVKFGDKEYKVGDIIEINGKRGRILADGSIVEL